jgi:glycosyltransferase involved in cell wall biosynthesis
MTKPILSLLVLTVPSRVGSYYLTLLKELERQSAGKPVEILGLYDNKQRSVGEKRNALLQMAQGEWCAFIDDDDWVAEDYVQKLTDAARAVRDVPAKVCVIVFDQTVSVNAKEEKLGKYGVEYYLRFDGMHLWTGRPTHTQCWRTAHAKRFAFPDKTFAEDVEWVAQVSAGLTLQNQYRIEGPPLYRYRFFSDVTETRSEQYMMPS